MVLLVYYNVVYQSISIHYEPFPFWIERKVGDYYKINSLLICIIHVQSSKKPLKIRFKRFKKSLRLRIGYFFYRLGDKITLTNVPTQENKNTYTWWK